MTFPPVKVLLLSKRLAVLLFRWYSVPTMFPKDGWSSVSHGWTCGHCWPRASLVLEQVLPSMRGSEAQLLSWRFLRQRPRSQRETESEGTRPTSKPSTLPEVNLAKLLDGAQGKRALQGFGGGWLQCKPRWSRPGKLINSPNARHAHPKWQSTQVLRPLQRQKAAQAKTPAKLVELEAPANAAVEAVEEAEPKSCQTTSGN